MSRVKTRAQRIFISRRLVMLVVVALQALLFIGMLAAFGKRAPVIYIFALMLSALVVLFIFDNDNMNPSYKILWLLLMMMLPVGGGFLYVLFGNRRLTPKRAAAVEAVEARSNRALRHSDRVRARMEDELPQYLPLVNYLKGATSATVYDGTRVTYFPDGERFFPVLCEKLEQAERFIFMEYFIIEEGIMWDTVLDILRRKVAQGVDVRLLYDEFGCLTKLPEGYDEILRSYGIDAHAFNPIRFNFHISDYMFMNHRDHRKICVIDGNVGFNGGLNLADEYINAVERFGYWKDTAYMLEGPAVYSLTVTFSKIYQLVTERAFAHEKYRPTVRYEDAQGMVQPFDDTPLDRQSVSEYVYLLTLNRAQRYVYIASPYLVIDNELQTALQLAARSGLDVRIITPAIPDKKYVYYLTQSYYKALLSAGVRIYEYTPGFIHAKMYVSDDDMAIVGSANMDYRSLYLHFESCGIFYDCPAVGDIKADFEEILSVSREVKLDDLKRTPLWKRGLQIILRLFAPLM